jgi:hypothetical protein
LVGHSDETNFEQQIIADNLDNRDCLIVDRQILHPGHGSDKLDLLALATTGTDSEFNFHVIEVKMGNNPELRGKVAMQLDRYRALATANLKSWKEGYRKTLEQLRELGFFTWLDPRSLTIGSRVTGSIVVFGYPALAKPAMKQLTERHSDLEVKFFHFKL